MTKEEVKDALKSAKLLEIISENDYNSLAEAVIKHQESKEILLSDEKIKNRFASVCKQINDENAVANVNLRSAISMAKSGVEKYAGIPEIVITNIQRILDHHYEIIQTLFRGKNEIDFDTYAKNKIQEDEEFRAAVQAIHEYNEAGRKQRSTDEG